MDTLIIKAVHSQSCIIISLLSLFSIHPKFKIMSKIHYMSLLYIMNFGFIHKLWKIKPFVRASLKKNRKKT